MVSRYTVGYRDVVCIYLYKDIGYTIYDTEIWDGSIIQVPLGYRYVQDVSIVSRYTLEYIFVG